MAGFWDSTKTGNIKVVAELYGEPGVPQILRLVEDALQTHPDLNVIWGGAAAAEAAVSAVADAGRRGIRRVLIKIMVGQPVERLYPSISQRASPASYPMPPLRSGLEK
ncbi:hypothetical protein [Mesorhizobium sp.]|uniref:hypothetical protein n=1 Tax=Mesorhizobium sp. TaxID=1871066 RepID=UPI0025EFD3BB|nr:hypothetical protein [Mesorhizobium sp.]